MARITTPPAIVVLGAGALDTARRIQARYEGARIHGLASRVADHTDIRFDELGVHLRELYARQTPIVALCAAGIVIRSLAPALSNKGGEPPVLAVAEDGSAVVPLLGGLTGVNTMAREIAAALDVSPAITTSGELRFGQCLLDPPKGYALASLDQGKRFVSDLLAGEKTRIDGDAPWVRDAQIPLDDAARLTIRVTPQAHDTRDGELLIHPQSVIVVIGESAFNAPLLAIDAALAAHAIAPQAVAAWLAPTHRMSDDALTLAAAQRNVALRFADAVTPTLAAGFDKTLTHDSGITLHIAPCPVDIDTLGQTRGTLSVVGLGPGKAEWMAPAAKTALAEATDILGYDTYIRLAGPFRADQRIHASDNREELMRARHAFELASEGRRVAIVSSGDPGVFAMAAAVMEALDGADDARWHAVRLRIVPGISAAMAAASVAGAPLGHDFCILSLSDNLKPWPVIRTRLRLAAQADLVMAFYNPISRARPWQLGEALDIVREHRTPDTRVVLGRDIGRHDETLVTTTLAALTPEQVDMRTVVIIGSSMTRAIKGGPHGEWIYTPRFYPGDEG